MFSPRESRLAPSLDIDGREKVGLLWKAFFALLKFALLPNFFFFAAAVFMLRSCLFYDVPTV